MTYAEMFDRVTPAALQYLARHEGQLAWNVDRTPVVVVIAEGPATRIRVWDSIGRRVRDEIIDDERLLGEWAREVYRAYTARLN